MSKWLNYFCGINNTLSVGAKLLQRFVDGEELPGCDFPLLTFGNKQVIVGKLKVIMLPVISRSIIIVHLCQQERTSHCRSVF